MNSVEVKGLSVKFGDFYAVKDISFSVKPGEIFGFLGANGAGKTTTIRVLCGLLEPTSGEVSVAGIGFESGLDAIKSKVGYMSQKFTLYDDLSVQENLNFTGSLRKMTPAKVKARTDELLNFVGFKKPLNTLVRDLPGGTRQQVSLAASMLHGPEIVFLDEPTAGVTPAARAQFWALIRRVSAAGKTVFVTTHYMDEAEQCGRIALMRSGEIIALDTPDALKDQTFPDSLFELEPRGHVTFDELQALEKNPAVHSVLPYGIRYHLVAKDARAWNECARGLKDKFEIKKIRPSLEDVFIQLVEGGNR